MFRKGAYAPYVQWLHTTLTQMLKYTIKFTNKFRNKNNISKILILSKYKIQIKKKIIKKSRKFSKFKQIWYTWISLMHNLHYYYTLSFINE